MKLKTFRGGIHPPDLKHSTRYKRISEVGPPASVRIPLRQNAGQPPCLIVERGRHVRTGEKIAEAVGDLSVPLHSSISGTVKRIGPMPVPYGGDGICIEIEGDGRDERSWGNNALSDPLTLDGGEILRRIKESGIVGLGGAEFPTHYKLSPADKKIDCLIINGAECEPYLTGDHRLMIERSDALIGGTLLLMKAVGVHAAYIGIEKNKRDAFKKVAEAAGAATGIVPVLLKVKYPQGAEKQIISAILNREVPPGGLPPDVGVIVQNVGTAIAVYEACRFGKPLYERVITVSGSAVRNPGNWLVRIGTSFAEVIEKCGGLSPDARMLIMGGPMMGVAQWTMDVPVVKGTTGIIALVERDTPVVGHSPCIRCGHCLRVCPMGLEPARIRRAVERANWEEAERCGIMNCIECGACAYVCPAHRYQMQLYKRAKSALKKRKSEATGK
jgi:electron transport complex protein RnfC